MHEIRTVKRTRQLQETNASLTLWTLETEPYVNEVGREDILGDVIHGDASQFI